MKVAIVYDRVNKWGGAERVLLHLNKLFPSADLFTSVYDEEKASWAKVFPVIHTTFLQKIPFAKKNHEYFSLLMPLAFESFNFTKYKLVISVTSEYAKNINTSTDTKHISIILTPTRYLWTLNKQYFKSRHIRFILKYVFNYLRLVDKVSSRKPDRLVSISQEVQKRVRKYYNLESEIVYPAVENLDYKSKKVEDKKYYLIVSRLVSYKKVGVVIKAFNKLGKNLVVIGEGRQQKFLKKKSLKNIKFLGLLPDEELGNYYKNAQALIFPGFEDFGLTPLEAQSFGTPVIAFNMGGAKETVVEGETGTFFDRQDSNSIIEAVKRFEKMKFSKKTIKENSRRFSFEKFSSQLTEVIKTL